MTSDLVGATAGRRIFRQALGELPCGRLQLSRGDGLYQAPFIGLLRGEAVLGKENLQQRDRCRPVPTMPTVLPPSGDTPILA